MSLETHTFRFGEFILDTREKVLRRENTPVPLTPKALQLLETLVVNHGHIVEKDRLMKTVWPDSFVEEGNLSFTVNLLRKALSDNKQEPRFIETVPKRGYRFVGKVSRVGTDERNATVEVPKKRYVLLTFLVTLIIGIFGIGSVWFFGHDRFPQDRSKRIKLTNTGRVTNAAITPDGNNIVYSQTEDKGEALWIRKIDSGNDAQILPAADVQFVGLTVSPKNDYVYYSVFTKNNAVLTLSRVPLGGGPPDSFPGVSTDASVAFSPDGRKFAFTEGTSSLDETYLKTADADGSNQTVLITTKGDKRRFPIFRASPLSWSPDGRAIACAIRETDESGTFFQILLVDPNNGAEEYLSQKRWNNIENIAWIDDQHLALIDSELNSPIKQIWRISRQTGESSLLTNDLDTYEWLGSANGNLVTVQKEMFSSLHVADLVENANKLEPKQIFAEANLIDNVAWSRDGRILYNSWTSGKNEVWQINPDGTAPRQLTVDSNLTDAFAVSAGGDMLVFPALKNGRIVLMSADSAGQNIRQLTEGAYDVSPSFSPDGKTVVFQRGLTPSTLWSVDAENYQPPIQITGYFATNPSVSPDGHTLAFHFIDYDRKDRQWKLGLIDAESHRLLNKFNFPMPIIQRKTVWRPSDGLLTLTSNNGENVEVLLMSATTGEFRTIDNIAVGKVPSFAWSPDGNRFAFARNVETSNVIFLGE